MRLRSRLLLSHGVVILLAIVAFAAALYAIQDLTRRVDALAQHRPSMFESSERIRSEFSNVVGSLLQRALAEDDETREMPTNALNALHDAIENSRDAFRLPEERAALESLQTGFNRLSAVVAGWQNGTTDRATSAALIREAYGDLRRNVVRLRELESDKLTASAIAARDFANLMFALLGALALLLLCVGIFATLRLVRVVCFQVDGLGDAVERISRGEYDIRCDEAAVTEFNILGHHLENMGRQLNLLRNTNIDRVMSEQRRTNAVLDSIDDGLVIFAEDGRIERINPVAERQLGADGGGAIGKRFEEIGDAHTGRHIRQVLASGEYIDAGVPEIRIERDNDARTIAYSLHRFVESESSRIGVVMVMRDVTIQHEFEKMRSEFVLRASHELRTPIASIRMGLGLLGEKLNFADGSRELELYQTVQHELTRMVGLLTDLLDLSRLRVGQQTFERAPTNIQTLLTDAESRFGPTAANAKIKLTLQCAPDLPHLSLSRSAFDRVLDNLINNALRHTSAGGEVTLVGEATPRNVLIKVADTGEGIALSQQALIFQPFVQIGSRRGGAGLGLAICKEIVQQHGGEISVNSQPKRGTIFTIALPI